MKQLQEKRLEKYLNSNHKMKDWQKQLAKPVIELALGVRQKVGKDAFKKGFKKKDQWICSFIEFIATGKVFPAPIKTKAEQPSTEVFVAKKPTKKAASKKQPAKKVAKKKTSK
jgi:hypothetical protein